MRSLYTFCSINFSKVNTCSFTQIFAELSVDENYGKKKLFNHKCQQSPIKSEICHTKKLQKDIKKNNNKLHLKWLHQTLEIKLSINYKNVLLNACFTFLLAKTADRLGMLDKHR